MATLLEDIAKYLEDNDFGTRGTDIFIGFLGDDVQGQENNIIMIDQTGGVAPDKDLPIAKPTVQIYVRNMDYSTGLGKLQAISNLLHNMNDATEFGDTDIMKVFALNEPQHYDRDTEERDIFTCTFVFQYRK